MLWYSLQTPPAPQPSNSLKSGVKGLVEQQRTSKKIQSKFYLETLTISFKVLHKICTNPKETQADILLKLCVLLEKLLKN